MKPKIGQLVSWVLTFGAPGRAMTGRVVALVPYGAAVRDHLPPGDRWARIRGGSGVVRGPRGERALVLVEEGGERVYHTPRCDRIEEARAS